MTRRVTLREVRQDDLRTFFEHQADNEANRMANFPPREREAFMAHWATILDDPTCLVRTVQLDDEVAGNVVSWSHDTERDVGYWIGREHWGAGLATAALQIFLAELEERPLHAHVVETNVGSIRVLEKCGFVQAGRLELPDAEGVELLYRLDGPPAGR